jgi:hypothetical protein
MKMMNKKKVKKDYKIGIQVLCKEWEEWVVSQEWEEWVECQEWEASLVWEDSQECKVMTKNNKKKIKATSMFMVNHVTTVMENKVKNLKNNLKIQQIDSIYEIKFEFIYY